MKRILNKAFYLLLVATLVFNMSLTAVFAEASSKGKVAELLEQMYERGNTSLMANDEPLKTIVLDNSHIIHHPAGTLPVPKMEMRDGKSSYALADTCQSGPFEESDERYFRIGVSDLGQDGDYCTVKGKVVATGASTNVWVVDDADFHAKIGTEHNDTTCNLLKVTYPMVKDLATAFDGIYSRMTEGMVPFKLYQTDNDSMSQIGDLGNDGHVNILLYDINALSPPGSQYTGGRFTNYDMASANREAGDSELIHPIDLLHIDIGTNQGWEALNGGAEGQLGIYYILAHEFQHMLFFTNFEAYCVPESYDYTWLDESLSGLAGMYFVQPGAEVVMEDHPIYAASNLYTGEAYGDFLSFNGSPKNYGMGALFSALYHKYTNGLYAQNVYKFLTTGELANDGTLEGFVKKYEAINNKEVFPASIDHMGAMMKSGLALSSDASYFDSLLTSYIYFMESFAADGGLKTTLEDGDSVLSPTKKSLQGTSWEQNLWTVRALLGVEGNALDFMPAIPTLESGGKIIIDGHELATKDMLYRLTGSGDMIDIKLPQLAGDKLAYFYLAVRSPKGLAGQLSADIYPLQSGNNQIVTNGRNAYLFAATFKTPLTEEDNVEVNYSWAGIGAEQINGTARIDNVIPRIGDILKGEFTNKGADFTPAYLWVVGDEENAVSSESSYTVSSKDLGKPIAFYVIDGAKSNYLAGMAQAITEPVKKRLYKGAAPTPPEEESSTHNSVTLKEVASNQYSNGGAIWQESPVFIGLSPNTSYTFYTRMMETDDIQESEKSSGTAVTTKTLSVSPLEIITQPISATYISGDNNIAPLSIMVNDAGGAKLSYHWYKTTQASTTGGTLIPRATSASYTPIMTGGGTNYYYCIVSKTIEGQTTSVTSNVVAITRATDTGGSTASKGSVSKQENKPTRGEINVTPIVDDTGNATVTVSEQDISKLIKMAQNATEKSPIDASIRLDSSEDINSFAVKLSQAVQKQLIDGGVKTTTISSDNLAITFDSAALKHVQATVNAEVIVKAIKTDTSTLSAKVQAAIGNRTVCSFQVTGNSKEITTFGNGNITLSLPYELQRVDANGKPSEQGSLENPNNLVGVNIDAKGNVNILSDSSYDIASKTMNINTPHLSVYGVTYKTNAPSFTDTDGHWAKEDIAFVAEKGILSGTGNDQFRPNASMTRGMFVTALGRLANVDMNSYKTSSFSDVSDGSYYQPYIEWAKSNNITNGVDDGKFAPEQSISRQEMAVMLQNYTKAIDYKLPMRDTQLTFIDDSSIASWAKEGVQQMQTAGILEGKGGGNFDPYGIATRGEVSSMLHRFMELGI